MNLTLVYITCKDKKEAVKIAKALLQERLIACANIIPTIESWFWWKGKIVKGGEALLLCKTLPKKAHSIQKRVNELHSYDVVCIEFIEVKKADPDYLKWVMRETSK